MAGSGRTPATVVTGSRCSGRAIKPSAKVREAANTTGVRSVPAKRTGNAIVAPTPKRVSTGSHSVTDDDEVMLDEDGDEIPKLQDVLDDDDDDNGSDDNGEEDEDPEEAYKKTKAFGDADRDVCIFDWSFYLRNSLNDDTQIRKSLKKDERTADLRTIFTEEKGHVNVHTGELEDGWWCEVCR